MPRPEAGCSKKQTSIFWNGRDRTDEIRHRRQAIGMYKNIFEDGPRKYLNRYDYRPIQGVFSLEILSQPFIEIEDERNPGG